MSRFISFGEVLLRLSVPPAGRLTQTTQLEVEYGGSEANIAAALARWGISSTHVTVFPQNDIGEAALQKLRSYGVNTHHIARSDGRMGIYFLEHGVHVRSPKVIYDRFESAFAKLHPDQFDWDEILLGAEWFHWSGITPAVSASAAAACQKAIAAARKKGIRISADINYRRVLWNYGKKPIDIMPALISQCDVVIGAPTDFENCLGITASADSTYEQWCELVQRQFTEVKVFANTERMTHHTSTQQLEGVWYENKKLYHSKNHTINPVIDRIGSGDAFMAGIVFSQLTNKSAQETISFATAAAVFKHSITGDVLLARPEEIEAVVTDETIGKLLR
jgi:2-dehydro-3-deoxygluconokinase